MKSSIRIIAIVVCSIGISAGCSGSATQGEPAPTGQNNEAETFQDEPQKPIDGDAPEAETEASLDGMRARLETIRVQLERAEATVDDMPEDQRLSYRDKLRILHDRRMNVVKSLDQIEAEEAGPEPKRRVFPIDAQKDLEALEVEVSRFDVEVRDVGGG